MKKISSYIIITILFSTFTFAQYTGTGSNSKTTNVKSYTKKDGSQIKEHKRTETNSYNLDNFKAKYNYNPYTGKTGKTTYKSPNNSYKSSLP